MYARQIDLDPAFTILDRGDAEDALNYVRNELGFSTTEERFPAKATCLLMYSRAVNARAAARRGVGRGIPILPYVGARSWGHSSRGMSRPSKPSVSWITTIFSYTGRA